MQNMQTRNRLRRLRETAGLSRRQLADKLDPNPATGESLDASTLQRWEMGETGIPDERKLEIAAHFAVSVSFLMGWDEYADTQPEPQVA